MAENQTAIPEKHKDRVELHAKRRAESLRLVWSDLSEAHRQAIRETIWAEMTWND